MKLTITFTLEQLGVGNLFWNDLSKEDKSNIISRLHEELSERVWIDQNQVLTVDKIKIKN